MRKKKALALLLTAAVTAGLLAGCGGSKESASTAGNAGTADTADTAGSTATAAGETADDGDYYVDEDGNKYK